MLKLLTLIYLYMWGILSLIYFEENVKLYVHILYKIFISTSKNTVFYSNNIKSSRTVMYFHNTCFTYI